MLQDWGLAKERFTIAIEERKTLQEKMLALQQKIEQDQRDLDQLLGVVPAQPSVTAPANTPLGPTVPGSPSAPALPTLATAAMDTATESEKPVSAGQPDGRPGHSHHPLDGRVRGDRPGGGFRRSEPDPRLLCRFHGSAREPVRHQDVVKINGTGGKVEWITLRMTVLRDAQGIVHFIPHGTITSVSNLTHGYSLAPFELGVAYKEDVDYVMQVLLQLGKELRQDPNFGPRILEDPEMHGVNALEDSAVILKFSIKTRPLQQWAVKREMLRRIKYRF